MSEKKHARREKDIGEKLNEILTRLETLEGRISQVEENTRARVRLSPVKGQPIVPNLYREIYPDTNIMSMYSVSDIEVDVTPIINEALIETLEAISDIHKEGEFITEKVANRLRLSRSTISGRLNMLCRLGLATKERQGRRTVYRITEKGEGFLIRE